MEVVMGFYGGMWVMGEPGRDHGLGVLRNPRIFIQRGTDLMAGKLPGDPEIVSLDAAMFHYPVRDEDVRGLYVKATTGIDVVLPPPLVLVK